MIIPIRALGAFNVPLKAATIVSVIVVIMVRVPESPSTPSVALVAFIDTTKRANPSGI